MRPWMDRAKARGRLHGRLLLVLVAVAVLASVAAIWQFSVLRDDDDPDLADIADRTTLSRGATDAAVTVTASASASSSPSASTSPTEAASSSAAASDPVATSEAAGGGGDSGPQCTASLTLDDEWEGTVSVTVTVANTGAEAFSGWEVELAIKHLKVTTTWGLEHVEGARYRDILLNGGIEPGGSVEPSFQAEVKGSYRLPETVPCRPI